LILSFPNHLCHLSTSFLLLFSDYVLHLTIIGYGTYFLFSHPTNNRRHHMSSKRFRLVLWSIFQTNLKALWLQFPSKMGSFILLPTAHRARRKFNPNGRQLGQLRPEWTRISGANRTYSAVVSPDIKCLSAEWALATACRQTGNWGA
jgi:hypothetical protein